MAAVIITTKDLRQFKIEILKEIKEMFNSHQSAEEKKWLRSPEVRKLLNISPGTLQNLRVNGQLPFTKIGGSVYYDYEDIRKMLSKSK
jgi:hypothetical protein